MAQMRRIEVDEEVWREMQKAAQPLIDSPNAVLRRLVGVDQSAQGNGDDQMRQSMGVGTAREVKRHCLVSARHSLANQEVWWYGIPPLGKKYQPGDSVTFKLGGYNGKKSGELTIELDGLILERLDRAPKDKKGYTHVKIVREANSGETSFYFGRKDRGDEPKAVTITEV